MKLELLNSYVESHAPTNYFYHVYPGPYHNHGRDFSSKPYISFTLPSKRNYGLTCELSRSKPTQPSASLTMKPIKRTLLPLTRLLPPLPFSPFHPVVTTLIYLGCGVPTVPAAPVVSPAASMNMSTPMAVVITGSRRILDIFCHQMRLSKTDWT